MVLDPFIGSGTTAVAALKTERHFIGIDVDEGYVKIAEKRIKDILSTRSLTEFLRAEGN